MTIEKPDHSIEVLSYTPEHRDAFRDLNYEWLDKYFEIEPYDRVILNNPEQHIISHGGHVLFARLDGEIVGTCALMKHTEVKYELAKMGVTERARGRQVGSHLAQAAIEKARELGAETLVLATSVKLDAANRLYRKLGFQNAPLAEIGPLPYSRETIVMSLDLLESDE